ncbi:PP2C family protein-serine/threonine phosphatase [Streptomyces sp. NBRC 110028]|uniref:PP2C family protein-serine/threonine phosphatase n=1 Tax=Streptomyces sp. NBRC 110028 TaxID=1621260 RepID=UPI0006E2AC7B|nr:PP2C family protein-serine/threonine phosphatase [Streptomyces sp. NBRC 110028]
MSSSLSDRGARGRRMLAGLLAESHLMPLEMLPARTRAYAALAGLTEVVIYLRDLQGHVLRRLSGAGLTTPPAEPEAPEELAIEETMAGRSYQLGQITADDMPHAALRRWVPLLDGTERVGVMRVTVDTDDAHTAEDMEALAALLALLIVRKADTSDTYARLTRTRAMGIAAEMQWNLMPERTFVDGRVAISGVLEPAYQASGDAYEYATDGPLVHLAIFDAMGHDTTAGLAVALAMGACRNARRQGAGLVEIGRAVDDALLGQSPQARYVTGVLCCLDTRSGALTWINRGHPPPIVIRREAGGSACLECPPAPPMGIGLGPEATVCHERLEPGDRIVLYTDGITEARRPGEREFGVDRFTDLLIRHHAAGLPVPETLRRVIHTVLDHHGGELEDDATILFCEWISPIPTPTGQAARLAGVPQRPD